MFPLYSIASFVLATREDRGVDASAVTAEESEPTLKTEQRRHQRAMLTLGNLDNIYCYKNDSRRADEWKKTLATVHEAGTWLIKHEESITACTQSKARGSTPAPPSSRR